jgi:hypothetical protein
VLDQPDYLSEAGKWLRVLSAVVLAPFALLFALAPVGCAVALVVFTTRGEWNLVTAMAFAAAVNGLIGAALVWLVVRLFRGRRAANGVTVLPLWFIQVVGVVLLPAAVYAACLSLTRAEAGPEEVALLVGPPLAMVAVPWLVRRKLRGGQGLPR